MEDEDIASKLIQSVWGRKSRQYIHITVQCTCRTFCPYRLDQLYVPTYLAQYPRLPFFGLIYIHTTHSSMPTKQWDFGRRWEFRILHIAEFRSNGANLQTLTK